ncbi:MAG: HD domain-containing protein [Thaumarchaeota archaeon]|nr:HD domain-containing protein [Nitrososphaerota archaeon]
MLACIPTFVIERARLYAERKHGITRRRGGLAIDHVRKVVEILLEMGVQDQHVICAAWLHDTIEDTDAKYDGICLEFGKDVADMVSSLSKDNRLPRDMRTVEYVERLGRAAPGAKTVKLADILANLESMTGSGADAAKACRKAAQLRRYLLAVSSGISPNLPELAGVQARLDALLGIHGLEPVDLDTGWPS